MSKFLLGTILMTALCFAGCGQNKKSPSGTVVKKEPQSGISPFAFPDINLSAQEGEYAFAPPERFVQAAHQEKTFFVYYLRNVAKVGPKETQLKIKDREEKVPNTLIIPLGTGQGAKLGDIVLTSNPFDNNSLTRGIVAEGGNEQEPFVHYLETRLLSRLDNRKFKLSSGTFRVLKAPGEPGSELVCEDKENYRGVILINHSEGQYLAMTAIGEIRVFEKTQCETIPLKPKVQVGDRVFIPIGSFYKEGKIKKIDERLGRLYVEYLLGKKAKERAFPYGVVAINEPGSTLKAPPKPAKKWE